MYDAARRFLRQEKRGAKVSLELAAVDGKTFRVDLEADHRGWYIPRLPRAKRRNS